MHTDEEWRTVRGYEGAYEVSNLGRVRSLDRVVAAGPGRTRKHVGRVLSAYAGDNYIKVRLKLGGGGKTHNVHSLVAVAFLGPVPDGMEVCHVNGDGHDNRAANLRYDTHVANSLDRAKHGVCHYARRTHCENGHEFTPENTHLRPEGGRACRACHRERGRLERAVQREAEGRPHRSELTECKYGHPLDGRSARQRFCTTCAKESSRRYIERKKAAS